LYTEASKFEFSFKAHYYNTLYIDSPCGSTEAVARHVSIVEITCQNYFTSAFSRKFAIERVLNTQWLYGDSNKPSRSMGVTFVQKVGVPIFSCGCIIVFVVRPWPNHEAFRLKT